MSYRDIHDLTKVIKTDHLEIEQISAMERMILKYAYDRGALIARGKPTGIIDSQIDVLIESMNHRTRVFLSGKMIFINKKAA